MRTLRSDPGTHALKRGLRVLFLVWPAIGQAQVPELKLKGAGESLPAEFVYASSVRELRDGRALLSDPRDRRIVIADFTTGKVAQVGRVGGGPREYRNAIALRPWHGDTTFIADFIVRRWSVLHHDAIVGELPPDNPVASKPGAPIGADTLGHILLSLQVRSNDDSISIVRRSLFQGVGDSIVRLMPLGSTPALTFRPVFLQEKAVIALDGWIAVVHATPYRVDWRRPDGVWVRGRPLAERPIPVTLAEKQLWSERGGIVPKGRQAEWPDFLPPQDLSPDPIPTPTGEVLILRTRLAADKVRYYDLVDRTGRRTGRIALPLTARVLGFGPKKIYVVTRDEDGTERVKRHDWP